MVKSDLQKFMYSSSLKQVFLQVFKKDHNMFMGNCYFKSIPYKLQRKIHKSAKKIICLLEKMEGCEY